MCGLVCPSRTSELGPVRNPVLEHRVSSCFPWFLSFGNRTQNSRVAGARSLGIGWHFAPRNPGETVTWSIEWVGFGLPEPWPHQHGFFGLCTAERPWEGQQVCQNVAPGVPRLRHGVGVGVGCVYTKGTLHGVHLFPEPWFPKWTQKPWYTAGYQNQAAVSPVTLASECLCCCLLLQYLIQSCARGGRRIVEDMCCEIRQAEACVD
jgi:hypothetical protein